MLGIVAILQTHQNGDEESNKVTDLIWHCPKCGGSNDRMEAVPGNRRFWLFGKRKTKLIAICIDCWAEMEFVGTF